MAIAAHTYRDKFFVLSLADGRHRVVGEDGEWKADEKSLAEGMARAKLLFLLSEQENLRKEVEVATAALTEKCAH